jgi:regulator of replication initiation timing
MLNIRRKFLCSQKEEMDKLYEEQEQQRIENVMLREQLEKTSRQYHEDLNTVEQERDALKHQVEEWVKKNHTTTF